MTFDAFVGLTIISFLFAYAILIVFNGLRDIFPHEKVGIKIDFKSND